MKMPWKKTQSYTNFHVLLVKILQPIINERNKPAIMATFFFFLTLVA